jgi:hypothetical protein
MGRGEASRVFEMEEVERFGIDFDSDIYETQERNRAKILITKTLIAINQNSEKEIMQRFGQIVNSCNHELLLGGVEKRRFIDLLDKLIVLRTKLKVGNTGAYVTNYLAQLSVHPPTSLLTVEAARVDGRIHARLKASDKTTLCGKEIRWESFSGKHALARDERYSDRFDLCMDCAAASRSHPDSLALNKALWKRVMSVEEYEGIMREVAIEALKEKKKTFEEIGEFRGYVDALFARLQLQIIQHGASVMRELDEKERIKRLFSTSGLDPTEATLVRQLRAAVRKNYPSGQSWPSQLKLSRLMEKTLAYNPPDESMIYNHAPAFIIGGAIYPLAFKEVVEKKCQEVGGQHELGFAYKYFQKEIAGKL